MAVGHDRLIVDERTEQTTKLYEIELAGSSGAPGSRGAGWRRAIGTWRG
jgi:hypothetical protein